MRIRYTFRAQNDLELIYSYLDQWSPVAAQALKATIRYRIASLQTFPLIAPYNRSLGLHALPIIGQPYVVYYEVQGEEVWVLHVRHSARRPPKPGDI